MVRFGVAMWGTVRSGKVGFGRVFKVWLGAVRRVVVRLGVVRQGRVGHGILHR